MASQYYRLIEIPEAFFGVLGSGLALLGFVVPGIARRLTIKHSALFNLLATALVIILGLAGMSKAWPTVGIFPALLVFSSLYMIGFFLSYYLNHAISSERRATVLSFKGLFLNLGYGGVGILYALLLVFLRGRTDTAELGLTEEALKNMVFRESLPWFSWYFIVCLLILLLAFMKALRQQKITPLN